MIEGKLLHSSDAQHFLKVIGLQHVLGIIHLYTHQTLRMMEKQRTTDTPAPKSPCYLQFNKVLERHDAPRTMECGNAALMQELQT